VTAWTTFQVWTIKACSNITHQHNCFFAAYDYNTGCASHMEKSLSKKNDFSILQRCSQRSCSWPNHWGHM